MAQMADETGLNKCAANFVALSPLSHLNRARDVYPNRDALVYGSRRYTYAQLHARCSQMASALLKHGITAGDVVSTICPNIPAIVEAHFGVPAAGAVVNTINTRLDADTIAYIFDHSEAKIALIDTQFLPIALEAIAMMDGNGPMVVEVADPEAGLAPQAAPKALCATTAAHIL